MRNKIFSMNRLGIYSLIGLSSLCSSMTNAQSLEEVVAQALETHPDIRQAFARFKSKEEDVNRASAAYLPTVDLTAGYGYEYTDTPGNRRTSLGFDDGETELKRGEFGVSLTQVIFDGMLTSSEVDRTTYEASAEKWTLIAAAEDLALEVSQAYLNYLKTEQIITLSEKNVDSHQEIYEQIKERTESGLGSVADLSQITGRLARAKSNMIAAQNNFLDARAQFIRVTNTTPVDLVVPVPDEDLLPKSREYGLEAAINKHPVIKSARKDIEAAQSFRKSVKASYYPTITFELNANADNDLAGESGLNRFGDNVGGHRNDVTAMVRLKYNLFSGGRDVAQERGAAYKINEAREINSSAHRQVTESYQYAWNAFEMLTLQKQYIKEHIITSKETQLAYKEQFSLGQRNLLDLLDTENELFQARQDYLDAKFSELGARYRLLNVTGTLLDSLRVTRSKAWEGEHNYEQGANDE